jgi:hypothetical protein
MIKTHTRIALLALLVAFGASAPAAALAKTKAKTKHNYSSTLQSAVLSTDNGFPNPGGVAWEAGRLKTKPFGPGGVLDKVTITGHPAANVLSFQGLEVDYLPAGMLNNTFTGTATVQADGSQKVAVTGRFTGGTLRFRGATGGYTFSGTIRAGSTVLTGHSSGSISY